MQEETKNKAAPVTPARGHCPACGKSFFWKGPIDYDWIAMMGHRQASNYSWRKAFTSRDICCPHCGAFLCAKGSPRWFAKARALNLSIVFLNLSIIVGMLSRLYIGKGFLDILVSCLLILMGLTFLIARYWLQSRQQFEFHESENKDETIKRLLLAKQKQTASSSRDKTDF